MVTRTFQIFVAHEMDMDEVVYHERVAENNGYNLKVNKDGRIITIDGMNDIYECIHFITNEFLLGDDVVNIRETVDYEPLIEPRILVEFE